MDLITNPKNIEYLIDFTGSFGVLFKQGKKGIFMTDSRYTGMVKELLKQKHRLPFSLIEWNEAGLKALKKKLAKQKVMTFEDSHMSVAALASWKKRLPGLKWIPNPKPIETERLFKDKEEIKKLKKSQQINEEVLKRIKKWLKPGVKETEVAWQIKVLGHELGAQDMSFEPIVAFGPNSAIPHHHPSDRKLKTNDLVLIDMGMLYQGYASDMTRTFFMGKPTAEQAKIYNLVLAAQEAGIKAVKSGASCKAADQAARQAMGEWEQYFGHSLGHGIGLDVHENPSLSSRSQEKLKTGMIVTVEPGIYLLGKFGVRIEDMGLVTEKGYENFTKMPKHLESL